MTTFKLSLIACGLATFTAFAAPQVLAAGSSPSTDTTPSANSYNDALQKVQAGDYLSAIPMLQQVAADDPSNADALNELGFSLRKVGRLPESLDAYKKALALNPSHIDANEYLGELYLVMKRPDLAKQQLDVLAKLCPNGCEQRNDLQEQLAAFKS